MTDDFGGKRAITNEGKREICDRLFKAWCKVPQLRLGQLFVDSYCSDPYYIEDWELLEHIEGFVSHRKERT